MTDARKPRLVITGSRNGHPLAWPWMDAWVAKHGVPDLFVVGDQRGVDHMAYQAAKWHGWPVKMECVNEQLPIPERFRERNRRMVDNCKPGDVCLAFPRPDSRGTWYTKNYAEKRGLTVFVAATWIGKELEKRLR